MEYVTYILICSVILGVCYLLFRRSDDLPLSGKSMDRIAQTASPDESQHAPDDSLASADSRLNVPTPWGWPGNQGVPMRAEDHKVSESLHRFVDHLLAEKQTVETREYVLKNTDSIRMLIEDRYGRSAKRPLQKQQTDSTSSEPRGGPSPRVKSQLHEVRTPWGW